MKVLVWPVAMYGCESWTLRKNKETHLDAFEIKGQKDSESFVDRKENKLRIDGCVVWDAHITVFGRWHSAISNRWFLGPTRFLDANSISITSEVFAGLTR